MKRYLLLYLVFHLVATNIHAQFLIGPKMGGHVGKIKFDRESLKNQFDPNLKLGFNLGVGVTFPVSKPFSLHTEVLMATKGKSVNITSERLKNTANYHYLEMPIMMRVEILPKEGVFFAIGPNLSYWFGGSGNITNIESTSTPIDYKLAFGDGGGAQDLKVLEPNRLQLGMVMGVGALFPAGEKNHLLLEFRVEMGHSYLAGPSGGELENLQFFDNLEFKHQLISINLGYFWTLHKKSTKKRSHTYKAKQRK